MLDALRKGAKTWVSKLLLLLLVASFAVWGISDQIVGGGAGNKVITAGDTSVSITEYRLAYDRQLNQIQRQIGQRITQEQARLFGVEQQVLGQLVGGALLDQQASDMDLGLSKDRLAVLISEDPAFQGVNGRFSRDQFRLVLREVGMREEDYIKNLEKVAVRQQIAEGIADGIAAPQTLVSALANYAGQKRDISFIDIDASALPAIAEPTDEALTEYFEANKQSYRAPEYRSLKLVRLTAEDIADPAAITDADVAAEYDANRARYTTPERRTIQQIVFPDREAAEVARQRILAGQAFEDAVTEAGRTIGDATLGTFTRDAVPDQTVAEAAFALQTTDDVSPIIDGAFGPVLVRVSEITPEQVAPLDTVRETIRNELALVEAKDVLLNVHDGYEDARAAGQSMDEAAAAQKLDVVTIAAVDGRGNGKDGNKVDLLGEESALLGPAFEADVGAENPPVNAGREGFLWYEVTDVEPDRDRTLDEIRERVVADWKDAETAKALDAEAERVAEQLRSGTAMADIANEKSYRTDMKFGLERRTNDPDFGSAGMQDVFTAAPGAVGFVSAATGNRRLVFKVDAINSPVGAADALAAEQRDGLSGALSSDLLDMLIARLQQDYPVSVNQTAVDRALAQGLN